MNKKYPVIFSSNTYVQDTLGILCEWIDSGDEQHFRLFYNNMNASSTIANVLGDKTAYVLPLQ